MGYSVGGASAVQAGLLDHRIVAVINIDGALSGPPADQIGPQAYFLLSSREAFPTEAELASPDPRRAQQRLSQRHRHPAQQAAHGAARQLLGRPRARPTTATWRTALFACAPAGCFAPTSCAPP